MNTYGNVFSDPNPNIVYGACAESFLRALPPDLQASVATMLKAAIVAGATASTRGNASLQKEQAEKILALTQDAVRALPGVPDVHACLL